jgi:hypothetical protein
METNLTVSERELLIMVLQKEENNLLIGINHCKHREFKMALKEELQMVTSLIKRLKVTEPTLVF